MKFVVLGLAAFALSAPAIAADQAPSTQKQASSEDKDGKDPNRMICKREKVTGSRLRSRKTCLTAAQWEEQRAADREAVEKIQANRYKNN